MPPRWAAGAVCAATQSPADEAVIAIGGVPTSTVRTSRPVAGSIATSRSFVWSATQTFFAVAATLIGEPPRSTVPATIPRRGSIREIVPSKEFATQIEPKADRIDADPLPTRIVRTIACEWRSIWTTVSVDWSITHSEPLPTATPRPSPPEAIFTRT